MITLYGVTSEGTSIPIEVTTEGKLVVDTSAVSGYIKQGDDAQLGTINATGKITGTDASFSGFLDSNGLTASPGGEGVIATRSSGGVRPVWRAGDETFVKEDGTTYTSQITAAGDAQFKGKVFSALTKDSDPDNTLVTKGFIASAPSSGPLIYMGFIVISGVLAAGSEHFTSQSIGRGMYNISLKFAAPNAYYTTLITPLSDTVGITAQVRLQHKTYFQVGIYDKMGQGITTDVSFAVILPPAGTKVNTDKKNPRKK